jgi:hypothetical protein
MADRFFVATRKGLFSFARESGAWRIRHAAFVGDNVSLVMADPRDGAVYAALDHGHFGRKLHRSTDGGQSFSEIGAPAYPPKPEGVEDLCPMRKTPIPWAVQKIWALAPGHPSEPGVLWCGTIPGGLFRSADHGATWELCRSLWDRPERRRWFGGGYDYPGIHSITVDPRGPGRLLLGVSCGGAWRTQDGGASWELCADGMRAAYMPPGEASDPTIQDPHCIVRCAGAPDTLFCQHHNGVFVSRDNGGRWTELTEVPPSTFGFAVAVHPGRPEVAWFAPALSDEKRVPVDGKLVVTRTRDGGRSFEVLRAGLPQEHAYHLVYRHGLDVDGSGERLALGTTTGSLFLSEDGGDSFRCISADLPPIYAVRFA